MNDRKRTYHWALIVLITIFCISKLFPRGELCPAYHFLGNSAIGSYVADSWSLRMLTWLGFRKDMPRIVISKEFSITLSGLRGLSVLQNDGTTVQEDTIIVNDHGEGHISSGRIDDYHALYVRNIEVLIINEKPPYALELKVGTADNHRYLRFELE